MNYLRMAHAGGRAHGRENSIEAVQAVLAYKPDLIELDVRTSRDGVLFCYHGFPAVPFFLLAFFLRYLPFSFIKKILTVNTLEEIFGVIKIPQTFYLDFKDKGINAAQIDSVCSHFHHKVWLASFSVETLAKWRRELSGKYTYIFNFSFWHFNQGLKKATSAHLDGFKLFPWQVSAAHIAAMKKHRIKHIIYASFLIGRAHYKKLVEQYGSLWICLDDFRKPEKWFIGI